MGYPFIWDYYYADRSCYNKVQWDQSITAVTLVMSTENTYLTTRGKYIITRYCELHNPCNGRTYIRLLTKQNILYVVCGIHRTQNGFNSSPPSATYMCQWTGSAVLQIMTCHLFGAKPLSKQMLGYCNWTLRDKIQWNFNLNKKIFSDEKAFEYTICKMAAILSRGDELRSYSVIGMLLPLIIIIMQNCSQALNAYSKWSRGVSKCWFGIFC